jgi:hypothetical protein
VHIEKFREIRVMRGLQLDESSNLALKLTTLDLAAIVSGIRDGYPIPSHEECRVFAPRWHCFTRLRAMLILPEYYPLAPLEDATPLVDNPDLLSERAADLGYLYFEGMMPASLVDPVRALACEVSAGYGWIETNPDNFPFLRVKPGAYLEGRGWDDPRFVELQRRINGSEQFHALVLDRRVMRVLEIVFGEPAAVADANQCWIKLPGNPEHTTVPHQDTYYLPHCPRMWSIWYPLVDTPLEVGPLALVPGSHKKDWLHVDRWTGISVPRTTTWATKGLHPGDMVAYGASTVHCAWSNVSPNSVRLTLDVRYEPIGTPDSILRSGAGRTGL